MVPTARAQGERLSLLEEGDRPPGPDSPGTALAASFQRPASAGPRGGGCQTGRDCASRGHPRSPKRPRCGRVRRLHSPESRPGAGGPAMTSLLPEDLRIYVASEPVDLRASFDRLAQVAKSELKKDPLKGGLFVFRNREGHRAKALLWDRTGWLLIY